MGVIRSGVYLALEAEADQLLHDMLAGVKSHSEKRDVLTPWKDRDRRSREVYVPSGTPDPSNRLGMYHRAFNAKQQHLNSRDGESIGYRLNDHRSQGDRMFRDDSSSGDSYGD